VSFSLFHNAEGVEIQKPEEEAERIEAHGCGRKRGQNACKHERKRAYLGAGTTHKSCSILRYYQEVIGSKKPTP